MRPALNALFAHHRRTLAAALAVLLVGAAVALATRGVRSPGAGSAPPTVELAPGQEGAIEGLLGRGETLPSGCRLVSAEINPRRISARYLCAGVAEPCTLDLNVGDRVQVFQRYAGRFGVGTSRVFPPALLEALCAIVASRSQQLQWRPVGARTEWRSTLAPSAPPPLVAPGPESSPPPLVAPGPESPPPPLVAPGPESSPPPLVAPGPESSPPPLVAPPPHQRGARDLLRLFQGHDPTLGFLAALCFILAFTARQLRRDPWRVAAALGLIVLFGVWVRVRLAVAAPMNAHSFTRVIPQVHEIFRGPIVSALGERLQRTVYFTDLQSGFNLALSSLMPLVFFTHARLLLGDARHALVAAALMAALPMHIRFAKSDVIFILSLVNSSLTFATIYGALSDPSRVWRVVCSLALPILSFATYLARPENYAFALLDLAALTLYLRDDIPRRRVAYAAVAIAGAAGYAVVTDLLVHYRQNVSEGLNLRLFALAWEIATDPEYNTLVNPAMTPPAIPVLAVLGGVTLWRGGARRKAVFLSAWLVTFFLVNSYVRAPTVAMQARYHLNLVSPLLLLAAAALPAAQRLPAAAQGALAALLLLSPWLHKDFVRDVDFTEMHESAFLRRHRALLRPGCTVLEYTPAVDLPSARYTLGARAVRMSLASRDGILGEVTARSIASLPAGARADASEPFGLPDDFVAAPPPCTYYYESAACTTHRLVAGDLAPACAAMHERFRLSLVGESRHAFRPLDDVIVSRVITRPDGTRLLQRMVNDRRGVRLALYRVTAR